MPDIFLDPAADQSVESVILGPYRPWTHHKNMGGNGLDYPRHSGRILDLKESKAGAVNYFVQQIDPIICPGIVLCSVPSHDPEKLDSGIRRLAEALSALQGRVHVADGLVRTVKVPKLAHGGDRSIEVHLNSIRVNTPDLVRKRNVLLLDDVTTTGNSLMACRQLLLKSGAARVGMLSLGRTNYQ